MAPVTTTVRDTGRGLGHVHHTLMSVECASVRITYVSSSSCVGSWGPESRRSAGALEAADYLSLSPAAILTGSRFSGGESGHDHIGSKAQDGW